MLSIDESANTLLSIFSNFESFSKKICVNFLQLKKAYLSIKVTLLGIVIRVIDDSLNAF